MAGAGEVRFIQPYDPVAQPFSSRKLARHPSDLFWARKGQILTLRYAARVDRGNDELSANSFVVPGTRFTRTISHAGTGEVQVPIGVTGLHDVQLTSDLGAFTGEVQLRWEVR